MIHPLVNEALANLILAFEMYCGRPMTVAREVLEKGQQSCPDFLTHDGPITPAKD